MIGEIRNDRTRYKNIPPVLTLTLRVCYDEGLNRRYSKDPKKIKQVLTQIMSYVSHVFLHPSLGVKVYINIHSFCRIGEMTDIKIIKNI